MRAHLRDRQPLPLFEKGVAQVDLHQDHIVGGTHNLIFGGGFGKFNSIALKIAAKESSSIAVLPPDQRGNEHSHSPCMSSVEFCQDGIFVRVSRDSGARALMLIVEDVHNNRKAAFPCHLDELLAAAHGITFQAGNPEGHVVISPAGENITLSFGLTQATARQCAVPKSEYEDSLLTFKGAPNP